MNPYIISDKIKSFYLYKGNVYKKIDEIQHKNPITRVWDVNVLYMDVKGLLYTRDINEFYSLFSEIPNFSPQALDFKIIEKLNS
jgi:hypothetical protein